MPSLENNHKLPGRHTFARRAFGGTIKVDMKLCPKCNAKNWPNKDACAICGESLDGVALTPNPSSTAPAPPFAGATQQIPAAQQVAPEPTRQMTATIPNPQLTQQLPVGMPQPPSYQAPPEKKSSAVPLAIIGVALLAVLVFVAINMMPKKQPLPKALPQNTITAFLEARKTMKMENVEPLLSAESIRFLDTAHSSQAARSAGFDKVEVSRMYVFDMPPSPKALRDATITYKDITLDEEKKKDRAVIEVTVTTQMPILGQMSSAWEYVLVPEDGQWKLDIPLTRAYQVSKGMDGIMGR